MRYLIVLSLLAVAALAYGESPRQATQSANRFAMIASQDGSIAWRMDTTNGSISYCIPQNVVQKDFACSPWVR